MLNRKRAIVVGFVPLVAYALMGWLRELGYQVENIASRRLEPRSADKSSLFVIDPMSSDAWERIQGLTGWDKLRRPKHPEAKVLVMLPFELEEHGLNYIQASGALGCLRCSAEQAEFSDVVAKMEQGQIGASPALWKRIAAAVMGSLPERRPSHRELQVLLLLGRGKTTKEIAGQLGISPKTVESHRKMLKTKLGLKTSNALYRYAFMFSLLRSSEVEAVAAPSGLPVVS